MVEGRLLVLHARVRQVLKKLNQVCDPEVVPVERRNSADISVQILQIRMLKVCTANIELNYFGQVLHAARVHVGTGQFNVAEGRCLESTVHSHAITGGHNMLRIRVCTGLLLTTV